MIVDGLGQASLFALFVVAFFVAVAVLFAIIIILTQVGGWICGKASRLWPFSILVG